MDYTNIIRKKTYGDSPNPPESLVMLEKWFISAFFLLKLDETQVDTVLANLPEEDELRKLFNNERRKGGDFFIDLIKKALEEKIDPPKKTLSLRRIIQFPLKKIVGKK